MTHSPKTIQQKCNHTKKTTINSPSVSGQEPRLNTWHQTLGPMSKEMSPFLHRCTQTCGGWGLLGACPRQRHHILSVLSAGSHQQLMKLFGRKKQSKHNLQSKLLSFHQLWPQEPPFRSPVQDPPQGPPFLDPPVGPSGSRCLLQPKPASVRRHEQPQTQGGCQGQYSRRREGP